jgi:multidrug efflux pump subunit AcrA (membrane-fusion protein)
MNKYIKIIIAVLIVAGLAIGGIMKIKEARAQDANLPKAKIYPIVVSQMSPKFAKVQLTLPYLAEVQNDKDVKLSSRIAARILTIKPSGSQIKKGELVVQLDITSIKSELKSLKEQLQATTVSLENLQATHKRTAELLKVKGASIEEFQKESSSLANMQAQLTTLRQKEIELKNNLSYSTITSPVDGVISKTFSNQGAISSPSQPLVTINSKNGFYLMLRMPTNIIAQGVILNNKSYKTTLLGSTFHGLAEYKVYTGKTNLISGDKVEVDVIVFNQEATLLPFDAILNKNDKNYVLVIDGEKVKEEEIHIIQSAQQGIAISENLDGKNIVVAKSDILLKLISGHALRVKD